MPFANDRFELLLRTPFVEARRRCTLFAVAASARRRRKVACYLLTTHPMDHADLTKLQRALSICFSIAVDMGSASKEDERALRIVRGLIQSAREEVLAL